MICQKYIWVRLADVPLCLGYHHEYIKKLFSDYQIIPTEDDRMAYEILAGSAEPLLVSDEEITAEGNPLQNYNRAYLESLAVYRKICHLLLVKDIMLFHSSALEMGGRAILFTAPSGTGKSTHARLWREFFGSKVRTINDDKPLLSFRNKEIRVYGTPYGGKEGLQQNISSKVSAIFILQQSNRNRAERMGRKEAYPPLLNQCYRGPDKRGLLRTLDLAGKLSELPVYRLECTVSYEAVRTAYKVWEGDRSL